MKTIITGASGFVGQNLSRYLSQHFFEINSISLRNSDWKDKFTADAIIHLAGKAHDTKNTSDASEYFKVNTDLTKELFDIFLESDVKDFIYFSSVKAAADDVSDVLLENTVPNPKTPYGQSKLQAENYILSKEIPDGKRVFIIRPCMIHGPGNKGNLNLLYKIVSKGLPWPLGAFENKRSFLSIDNLCFIVKELLERADISSGIYNIADNEPLSTNELIELLGQSLGKQNRIWNISASFIKKTASLGDILKLPLNSERLQKLTENYVVSNKKIREAIGKELPVSSREGLLITFESFK
ncbi:NAD-dependent epimerase/dehydratase family protein [Flavobacterium aestuarii]|uniref:NAD-dependent epimerase/dehydratase family protein n=1 Tax=Flavobacterium aestuarii TaxID=3149227 RepID=UPI0032B33228